MDIINATFVWARQLVSPTYSDDEVKAIYSEALKDLGGAEFVGVCKSQADDERHELLLMAMLFKLVEESKANNDVPLAVVKKLLKEKRNLQELVEPTGEREKMKDKIKEEVTPWVDRIAEVLPLVLPEKVKNVPGGRLLLTHVKKYLPDAIAYLASLVALEAKELPAVAPLNSLSKEKQMVYLGAGTANAILGKGTVPFIQSKSVIQAKPQNVHLFSLLLLTNQLRASHGESKEWDQIQQNILELTRSQGLQRTGGGDLQQTLTAVYRDEVIAELEEQWSGVTGLISGVIEKAFGSYSDSVKETLRSLLELFYLVKFAIWVENYLVDKRAHQVFKQLYSEEANQIGV